MPKLPIALAALVAASAAAPAPARPLDVRWGECVQGTTLRLARHYRFTGYPVGAVKGRHEFRWPAFKGTFMGIPNCTVQPLYHVDSMRLEAPVLVTPDYALQRVDVELPTVAPAAVPTQTTALVKALRRRFGPIKKLESPPGMSSAQAPNFRVLRKALTAPSPMALPAPVSAAIAGGALSFEATWQLPASDDNLFVTLSRWQGPHNRPAPLHLHLSVESLRATRFGTFEAVFTAPGVPRVADVKEFRGMSTYYEFYDKLIPFHPPGEAPHPKRTFDPPPGWPTAEP